MNNAENKYSDFLIIDGEKLMIGGLGARTVLYLALVTALTANELNLPICENMPLRERIVKHWLTVAHALREQSPETEGELQ